MEAFCLIYFQCLLAKQMAYSAYSQFMLFTYNIPNALCLWLVTLKLSIFFGKYNSLIDCKFEFYKKLA